MTYYRYNCPSYNSGILSNCDTCIRRSTCEMYHVSENSSTDSNEKISGDGIVGLYGLLSQPKGLSGELIPLNMDGTLSNGILRGFSAYQIAQKNGFEGSEEEWLESLRRDEIEFQSFGTVLSWRYKTDENWTPIVDFDDLFGEVIEQKADKDSLSKVATSGNWNDLEDKPVDKDDVILII